MHGNATWYRASRENCSGNLPLYNPKLHSLTPRAILKKGMIFFFFFNFVTPVRVFWALDIELKELSQFSFIGSDLARYLGGYNHESSQDQGYISKLKPLSHIGKPAS